jgi:predicted transporter
MLELLWQLGILLAILVFGVKIGLVTGFAGLSKKSVGVIAANYGAGIYILTFLISERADMVYKVVNEYSFVIFMALALIITYTGFYTLREWKLHGKNSSKVLNAAMIALCPCCFGAVLAAIVLASPFTGVSIAFIGQYAAIYLSFTIVAFYFASGAIIRISKEPFPVLLGNFMLFVGLFFLAFAILIPNIDTVLKSPMSPVNVPSVRTLIYASVVVIILLFIGFYRAKKKSDLIQK